MTGVLNSVPGG